MKSNLLYVFAAVVAVCFLFSCGNNGGKNEPSLDNQGRDYVDLGLSSGTLWATCNIGATAPEEYGGYVYFDSYYVDCIDFGRFYGPSVRAVLKR